MQKLGLEYRGQRLAGAAAEAFQHLLKAQRLARWAPWNS